MKRSKRRRPKIPTRETLLEAALAYLSRFAASEQALRRVLQNRIRRTAILLPEFSRDVELQQSLRSEIETIIIKYRKSGVLNDAAYAEIKARSLRRKGRSRRAISNTLGLKGIKSDAVQQALAEVDGEAGSEMAEFEAAVAFARRKKLGRFRERRADVSRDRKDFAALARAGFSADAARKALGREFPDEM
jgi:regulatory protein